VQELMKNNCLNIHYPSDFSNQHYLFNDISEKSQAAAPFYNICRTVGRQLFCIKNRAAIDCPVKGKQS